jgi:hypothetical protein
MYLLTFTSTLKRKTMKAIVLALSTLVIGVSTILVGSQYPSNSNSNTLSNHSVCKAATSGTLVKTHVVDGQRIPVVNLPEISVVSELNKSHMVRAILVDGEVVPVVTLPEFEVFG